IFIATAFAGILLYQKLQPDIVVDPNITDAYSVQLQEDLAEKEQKLIENPKEIDTLLEAGLIEQMLGFLSAAERRFKKALKINKADYIAYMYLGILYDEMERFDKADDMLRISTQLEPRDPKPFQALITLYKQHYPGEADELENIFRAASDFTKSPEIWAEYAQFLEDRREFRQAWIYWQEIVSAEPENIIAKENVDRLGAQIGSTK
ncbi:MAG: hypothetical protein QGG82_02180, partial [Patescibacteria group bacterium]|nr:hypothetical protein [Patescibacteria group bacterium]